MSLPLEDKTRFDARLPKEKKQYFEKAAYLGGFRSLTEFVLNAAQEKANAIIKEKEQIIASEKDGQVFFDAITNPKQPSETLKNALKEYDEFISKEKK